MFLVKSSKEVSRAEARAERNLIPGFLIFSDSNRLRYSGLTPALRANFLIERPDFLLSTFKFSAINMRNIFIINKINVNYIYLINLIC